MKKAFIKSLGLLLALSACQKENSEIGYSDIEEPVSVSFSSLISRVVGIQWEQNDEVGISATDGNSVNYTNVKYLSDASGNFTVAEGVEPICFGSKKAMSFTAYYPYSSAVSENLITGNTITDNKKCNFLWNKVENVEYSTTPAVNFTFKHSMAELRIELTYPEGTNVDAYKKVTISGLKHDGNFNINTGVASPSAEASAQDWNIALSGEGTTALSFKGVIFPQAVSGMVLKMNNVDYNINFKETEEFKAGKNHTISAVINADGSVKVSMKISGATIEGYDDGGVANIAFLSTGANVDACDDEAKAAYNWLTTKYSKVSYIPVTSTGDLSDYDLVWAHISKRSDYETENTYAIDNSMNSYYKDGGKVIASKGATVSINKWGISAKPNNCWGNNSLSNRLHIHVYNTKHPIFAGLNIEAENNIWLHGDGFSGFEEVYQWKNFTAGATDMGQDWNNRGGVCLASESSNPNTTVRIAEFKNDKNGAAIVIGDPAYIWQGTTSTADDAALVKLTVNTIEYLLNL